MDTGSSGSLKTGLQPSQRRKPQNIDNQDIFGLALKEARKSDLITIKLIYLFSGQIGQGYLSLSEYTLTVGFVLNHLGEHLNVSMMSKKSQDETEAHTISSLKFKFQFHD